MTFLVRFVLALGILLGWMFFLGPQGFLRAYSGRVGFSGFSDVRGFRGFLVSPWGHYVLFCTFLLSSFYFFFSTLLLLTVGGYMENWCAAMHFLFGGAVFLPGSFWGIFYGRFAMEGSHRACFAGSSNFVAEVGFWGIFIGLMFLGVFLGLNFP